MRAAVFVSLEHNLFTIAGLLVLSATVASAQSAAAAARQEVSTEANAVMALERQVELAYLRADHAFHQRVHNGWYGSGCGRSKMPWVPWIHVEADDQNTRDRLTRKLSDLTRLTSATPVVAELLDQLCTAVYGGENDLTVREKEMAALITSSLNGCVH